MLILTSMAYQVWCTPWAQGHPAESELNIAKLVLDSAKLTQKIVKPWLICAAKTQSWRFNCEIEETTQED